MGPPSIPEAHDTEVTEEVRTTSPPPSSRAMMRETIEGISITDLLTTTKKATMGNMALSRSSGPPFTIPTTVAATAKLADALVAVVMAELQRFDFD